MKRLLKFFAGAVLLTAALGGVPAAAQEGPRARDVGIKPGIMEPGPLNAITDVRGVRVGQVEVIEGNAVQTGLTAILPHSGNLYRDKVPAAVAVGNGFGKLMGLSQIEELGEIETPILLTNTLSVPEAAKGIIEWTLRARGNGDVRSVNAVVGETNDGRINDIRARRLNMRHAVRAIESARSGPVREGSVGAGRGTVNFGFKGGIGTSSRRLSADDGGYMIGVLVQTNYGGDLHILGLPVGRLLEKESPGSGDGSVMIVIATDAPLSSRNLKRLARRAFLGIARTGSVMSNGSGDYAIAFSTDSAVRRTKRRRSGEARIDDLANAGMTPLFQAVVEATEEAVYNALFKATAVLTPKGELYPPLPLEKVLELLSEHKLLETE